MNEDEPNAKDTGDRARAVRAAAKGREKLKEVQNLLAAIRGEVEGDRFWRYQRNVSPGLQEYIEALSFAHYLETGTLVSFNQVQQSLSDKDGVPVRTSLPNPCLRVLSDVQYFPLTLEDYLLGLSDLTGELMRYAISAISRRGGRTIASEVCTFVRNCRAGTPQVDSEIHSLIKFIACSRRFRGSCSILQGSQEKTSSDFPISAENRRWWVPVLCEGSFAI